MKYKPLPIGFEDFKEIIQKNLYYVDKTLLIKKLLDMPSKATLFTRPRRFGKTLNQMTIKYFFEDTGDEQLNAENKAVFEGLKIMETGEEYTRHMQKYPVIFLSLKSAKQRDFDMSFKVLRDNIAGEFKRHNKTVSGALSDDDLKQYCKLRDREANNAEYFTSLAFLSECLEKAYGKKTIILIDEYDVPLESAYYGGFYDEMVSFIRSLFESALKTNPSLEFAVITGCLRISKESIFTGLNNLRVVSITDKNYGEYFGFTPEEVESMTEYYGHAKRMQDIRNWYDGYIFGDSEVYNPWSVIYFMSDLNADKNAFPRPYWANTSSNDVVQELIQRSDNDARADLEILMSGGIIEKPVYEDITYRDIYKTQDNLWNFLFFTGYLKKIYESFNEESIFLSMKIPNKEIQYIYRNQISYWFTDKIKTKDLSNLYNAMLSGDEESFKKELSAMLMETIRYMDSKEAFYHGFLLGVLANLNDGYLKKSNREAGNGRYDICVYNIDETKPAVILELKAVDRFKEMEFAAGEALMQIADKGYDKWLPEYGYTECFHIGIGFFRKRCRVKVKKVELD